LKDDSKMSAFDRKQKELAEMDKVFAEMGIEVEKVEAQDPAKKNKRRRKKKNKDKDGEKAENADNEEVKTDDKKPEAEVIKTEELPLDPVAKEAAIKEALFKRFNKNKKKTQKDDAFTIAKKEALEKAKRKKKGKKSGFDL
jgi:hypothetical protein